ncbi:uncharacterized protein [Typha angustifolia]|uniref:uncharacterized protein n=1 Tax=Typha angustifolia TaxID=59011 RepID=UPI003C2F12C4
MALALRLRRAIALSSSLLKHSPFASVSSSPPSLLSNLSSGSPLNPSQSLFPQSLSFHSSALLFDRRSDYGGGGEERKISPDEILFEGCDYNHWLITMDFPKDPKPTPEEMVETYVQTLAKVVGSVEEAKKRMYACSTTTYTGFQAVMTEEMSEKFRGLPGVVFILPDSYLYPETKEYGGDKYDNGVITPRPPPIHYGRQSRPRNQNRFDRDRPSYNGPPPQGNFQNSPPQGSMQGDARNYTPQQSYTQPGQDGRGYDSPGGRDFAPPSGRPDFGQGQRRDYAPPGGRDGYNDDRRGPAASYQRDFNQGDRGNFAPQEQRNFSQGPVGDFRSAGSSGHGDYNQGSAPGYSGHNQGGSGPGSSGEYRPGANSGYGGYDRQGAGPGYSGDNRQGAGSGYGQNYPGPVEGQPGSWQGRP